MIRGLVAADADVIAPLARAARFDAIPGLPDLHTPAEDRAFYRQQIEERSGLAVLDDDSGVVAGFVMWSAGMIDHLYVSIAHQRRGIGSTLLDAALTRIEVRPVRLWAFADNVRAVAFYRKHGFIAIETTDGAGNEEGLPDILFELR